MKQLMIKRLFESFSDLERAIQSAKTVLASKAKPPKELIERIASYEEILEKQRNLATTLCGHASLGNWDEVTRHIRLINGLSAMIRDDAREIVAGVRTKKTSEDQREMMLC